MVVSAGHADWKPPEKPDPHAILNEAKADAGARRYADALAKHLWFHDHALKYESGMYGVRLSFALISWHELGKQYPPALEALKDKRASSARRVKEGKGGAENFHDFAAISEVLAEDQPVADLFAWLDQNNPALARKSYRMAEKALIRTKAYELCGKHIDSRESLNMLLQVDREHRRMVKDERFGPEFAEYVEKSFSHGAATLVALLVVNKRTAEADEVVAAALKEKPSPKLKKELDQARRGKVPDPWPTMGS